MTVFGMSFGNTCMLNVRQINEHGKVVHENRGNLIENNLGVNPIAYFLSKKIKKETNNNNLDVIIIGCVVFSD